VSAARALAALVAVSALPGGVGATVGETAADVTGTAITTTAEVGAAVVTAPIRAAGALAGDEEDAGPGDEDAQD